MSARLGIVWIRLTNESSGQRSRAWRLAASASGRLSATPSAKAAALSKT